MLVRVVSGMQHRVSIFLYNLESIVCTRVTSSSVGIYFALSSENIDLLNSFSGVLQGERFSCILVITL